MGKTDLQEVSEMLEVLGEKVPKLVKEVIGSIYAPSTAADMGRAVGIYYKELVENGIPREDALQMARDYSTMMSQAMKNTHMQVNTRDDQ